MTTSVRWTIGSMRQIACVYLSVFNISPVKKTPGQISEPNPSPDGPVFSKVF